MSEATIVLSRHPDGSKVHRDFENALAARLANSARVLLVPHVYYLRPSHAIFSRLAENGDNITVGAWLKPRATRWLFSERGINGNGNGREPRFVDLSAHASAESCIEDFLRFADTDSGRGDTCEHSLPEDLSAEAPRRWYPVLDYSRCTDCKQCLNFCLFGVYSVGADGKVQVEKPDNCKTNCPACARICPEVAVIFPEYGAGPIDGSEAGSEDELGLEKVKVDVAAVLGSDVYAALRNRARGGARRFAAPVQDVQQAVAERHRCACLAKMSEEYGIPAEALMSSPFKDEILRKMCSCCPTVSGSGGSEVCDCDCDCC
ncbi:MAG: hypothetical protein QF662_01030 [Phycisphaerae bacterium]|nr:hypothetical protein [Phycisphaerae bacterium]